MSYENTLAAVRSLSENAINHPRRVLRTEPAQPKKLQPRPAPAVGLAELRQIAALDQARQEKLSLRFRA